MTKTPEFTVVLDVGHGSSAVVHVDGKLIVVDACPGSTLLEHVSEASEKSVALAVLSHADADHIGGMVGLLSSGQVEVEELWVSSDAQKGTDTWEDLKDAIEHDSELGELRVLTGPSRATQSFSIGNCELEVLAPRVRTRLTGPGGKGRKGRKLNSNSLSVVLRLRVDNHPRVLFAGDLDQAGLDELTGLDADLNADVLIYPHHGGRPGHGDPESFASAFMKLVQPDTVVFSLARSLKPNNPLPEVVRGIRVAQPKARLMCTQMSGTCQRV